MISLFFNETGYSIQGDGVEIVQSCSPAVDSNGNRVFSPIHHLYGVCFKALQELVTFSTAEDITVYNDSRVMEELNGVTTPQDSTCGDWHAVIIRSIIPAIKACVLFRKKSPEYVAARIRTAQEKSIVVIDPNELIRANRQNDNDRRTKKVRSFKENWHGKRQED